MEQESMLTISGGAVCKNSQSIHRFYRCQLTFSFSVLMQGCVKTNLIHILHYERRIQKSSIDEIMYGNQ